MNEIAVQSPAKINLALHILKKRSDGYHEINTILQKVSLFDELSIKLSSRPGITVTADDPSIPTDSGNLAYKAAFALLKDHNISTGIAIHIKKSIPAGAGLGGGSSNAAATLMGLNRLFGFMLTDDSLKQLGLSIGADVPFFLFDKNTALAQGIGEVLNPVTLGVTAWFLIIFPGFGISTSWAYSNYKLLTNKLKNIRISDSTNSITDFKFITALLKNDLEDVVIPEYPEIQRLKLDLVRAGASGSLMSGSGSAVFGIFPDEKHAQKALSLLSLPAPQRAFIARSL
ncbi:MAG: 4-(cytidine 5'-diphospho)-2-C-methyl-D-erythritol kinase [Proteobacteria bacterium]|nr:4-(cytidine 5'-diphospho)-2-C-methyl-D-erythritol kinase [Pseudomonadota bacterium]